MNSIESDDSLFEGDDLVLAPTRLFSLCVTQTGLLVSIAIVESHYVSTLISRARLRKSESDPIKALVR